MVELVRGKLTTGARITICALIVIDVHGIYVTLVTDLNISNMFYLSLSSLM